LLLSVFEFDMGASGVENKSSRSTDSSVWEMRGGDLDGISRISINGSWESSSSSSSSSLLNDNRDDDDNISSCSCSCSGSCSCSRSCSDIDGVEIDEVSDDERSTRLGESIWKVYFYRLSFI
jgi:hypothetical protein